jgi:centromeric protein E
LARTTTLNGQKAEALSFSVPIPIEKNPSIVAWDVVTDDTVCQSRETDYVQGRTHSYTLDRVYSPLTTTQQIYQQSVRPLVQSALDGYHTAVLAYGQTSTGKTFTMSGTRASPGLIPLAIRDCFHFVQTNQQDPPREYLLRVSYLEVYKEHIRDLLVPQHLQPPIRLFDHKDGLVIRGLREEVVASPDQVLNLLQQGEARRHVGSTLMNQHSSRSHVILRLWIESRPATGTPNPSASSSLSSDDTATPTSSPKRATNQGDGAVRVSSLSLVDLAGSESVRLNGSERREEGQYINKSLMTLGQIVLSLSEAAAGKKNNKQPPQHIPYRDSKLTRLLQPCLSGNAQLVLVCCISPMASHLDESHNTLKFATRAKRIPQRATIQEVADEKTLLQTYREEIEELKAQLAEAKEQQRLLAEEQKLQMQQQQQEQVANINGNKPVSEPGFDDQEIVELVEAIQTMERLILKSQVSPTGSRLRNDSLEDIEEGNETGTLATISKGNSEDETTSFKFLGDVEDERPHDSKVNLNVELNRIRKLLGSVLEKKRHHRLPSPRRINSMADDDYDYDDDEVEVLRAQLQQHEVTTSLRKADSSFLQSQLEEKDQLLQEISSVLEAVEQRQLQLEAENAAMREEVHNLREINRDLQERTRPTGMTQTFHPLL